MKTWLWLGFAALTLTSVGCRNNKGPTVLEETYIHKYGVPIPRGDWTRNGKNGKVVQLDSDGVTISRSYENGILNGETTYTFPNSSTIEHIETYKSGELIAKTQHFLSGVPMFEEKYSGQQISEITRWYEDGSPALIEKYESGKLASGEYRSHLNMLEARVTAGIGTRVNRSADGELVSRDNIQNGAMVERVTFFPNGDPSSVTPYEAGVIHGTRLTFLSGGLPNTVEQWVHGAQDGITVVYQNGEKIAEVPFVKGYREGIELRYREGKTLVEEVTWHANVQHGPRRIMAGETTRTEWYHQGEQVSRPTYERMNLR